MMISREMYAFLAPHTVADGHKDKDDEDDGAGDEEDEEDEEAADVRIWTLTAASN